MCSTLILGLGAGLVLILRFTTVFETHIWLYLSPGCHTGSTLTKLVDVAITVEFCILTYILDYLLTE